VSLKDTLLRLYQSPDLVKKIKFTLLMILVFRIGDFIPVPGIDGDIALSYFRQASGGGQNLFQLIDIFSGGAFSQMTIFALGVVPYISASIIIQLLVAIIPGFQREMRENPEYGRRKLGRYTRFGTVILSFIQSALFARFALGMNQSHPGIVSSELLQIRCFDVPWLFYLIMIFTMTTGTCFLMWIAEQITEKGIGNGMSLIIAVGIVSQLPSTIGLIIQQLNLDSPGSGQLSLFTVLVLVALFIGVTVATIFIIQGQRKIQLQYARRVVGIREVQGMGSSYLPLKVNYAGVIPVIFASSLLMFPATLGQFIGQGNWIGKIADAISPGSIIYLGADVLLIIFFTYFWTATQFHPDQIASEMKKNGAFIPGVRQGKHTQDFLEQTMHRITLIGALSLAALAIFPSVIVKVMGISPSISYFFGGTSLLILVGVVLDTMKQIDSHLIMKKYDGFMRKSRVR
jgi:preprotein translocase subunit SecY